MALGTLLVACPSCACHAFARETRCPSCGELLRDADGSLQRTAGAVVLGLTLAVSVMACSSETKSGSTSGEGGNNGPSTTGMGGYQTVSAYGVGPSSGSDSSSSGQGGSSTTGMGGYQTMSTYGVGPSSSSGSSGQGGAGGSK